MPAFHNPPSPHTYTHARACSSLHHIRLAAHTLAHIQCTALAAQRRFIPQLPTASQDAISHPFLARVRAARHTVSELPAPARFRMHSQLSKLKSGEIRALFIGRLCGDYTPDAQAAPGELFPAAAVAAVERRGRDVAPAAAAAASSSSSSSSAPAARHRTPMSSPAPRRPAPAMHDGMFVHQEGAARPADDRHVANGDEDEDDEFDDAVDMDAGDAEEAPDWLRDDTEVRGSAGRARVGSSASAGGFVNAEDVSEDVDEDEGDGAYAYGASGEDAAYWGAHRSGGAGALAAELLEEQVAAVEGRGLAAHASAAARAASASSSSSSSSAALHAVVGRSSGSTLVQLPAHTRSALGGRDMTAMSSGSGGSTGNSGAGVAGAIAGRRVGRGTGHLSVAPGSKPSATAAVAFVSPAGGAAASGGQHYARSVSPIATPEDSDDVPGDSSRRFHATSSAASASRVPPSRGIHRSKPAARSGPGAPPGARRAEQRGPGVAPSGEATDLGNRRFAGAGRAAPDHAPPSSSSSASATATGSIPTRALPQPVRAMRVPVAAAVSHRPLSRGGAAALATVTPPRQSAGGAVLGSGSSSKSLSVTPGMRRTAGGLGSATASVGRSGFAPDGRTAHLRGSILGEHGPVSHGRRFVAAAGETGTVDVARGRRARSSLEFAGAQAAVSGLRQAAWQ